MAAARPAPAAAYSLVDAAAAVLVPAELCERLLGGTPAPAELPAYVAAWLEAADPSPLEAALVLYATGAHIGLPELGLAGRRRIGEALEKFRRHYGLADDQLVAHLSEAATVWSPVRLWFAAAAVRDARLVRTRELPDQLREQASGAEAARREAEERSRALAVEAEALAGRLDRLRHENDAFRTTAERLRHELDALGTEAARAVDLEAQLARVRAREVDMRARLDELERASAPGNGAADSADADEDDAPDHVEQTPDLSAVYLLVLHSNDKDNTPAEVRDELLARGIGHVETQRIDESRVPASFPRGAIVAIDTSFMSHPVAEKAYDNAIAAAAPVFRFTKLGPARLHRRLVRFLRDQYTTAGEDEPSALPGTRDRA